RRLGKRRAGVTTTESAADYAAQRAALFRGCISLSRADAVRLLAIRPCDLPHELGPGHVDGIVHGSRFRPRIVLEDFHLQRRVVGADHAGLPHAQKADLSFRFTEGPGSVDRVYRSRGNVDATGLLMRRG